MKSKIHITKIRGEIKSIQVDAKVEVINKHGQWAVNCPELKTYGFSTDSKELAFQDLDKAIKIFFKFHVKQGTLTRALEYFNWREEGTDASSFLGVIEAGVPIESHSSSFELAAA
jgi:predicted RNase H-like HicB family nuclease